MGGTISERKLAANRANARLSTGPRTPEGKARSSRNALKHALLSSQILLDDENANEMQALWDGLYADLQPVGTLEETLVDKIVACVWLQKRAAAYETTLTKLERSTARALPSVTVIEDEDSSLGLAVARMVRNGDLDRLQRYETSKERQMYRALHELQRLQADRQSATAFAPVAVDVDVRGDGSSTQ